MSNILKFHMVRHGPVFNPDQIWYGRDVQFDVISPEVIAFFERLAVVLPSDPDKCQWYASDYQRARAMGEAILNATQRSYVPLLTIDKEFGEQKYGMMEGMKGDEAKHHPQLTPYFQDMWNNAPPDGESLSMLQNRVARRIDYIAETAPDYVEDIVVAGHGGETMAACAHAMGRRMIDVFNERRLKIGPSYSYMSRLELQYDRTNKAWMTAFEYDTGIPKNHHPV